jgi:DNA-binding NtrC family response regulator
MCASAEALARIIEEEDLRPGKKPPPTESVPEDDVAVTTRARHPRGSFKSILTIDPDLIKLIRTAERAAGSVAPILLEGETGVGKELFARAIHGASRRSEGPFVAINAGGMSVHLLESELFGHVKGAFTDAKTDRVGYFELADGGTLFLDEIGNMPARQQSKLLRVLQTGEFQRVGSSKTKRVDVRLISATNVDIGQEVAEGRFREDLLYRLNTVEIHLPPLRERGEDIAALAAHFLRQQGARYGTKKLTGLDREALRALHEHPWPGNIRELEHTIERAVLMAAGPQIRAEDLGLRTRSDGTARLEDMTLEDAEKHLIRKALARCQGNVSRAADALGLSRSALYRRLQQYDIAE